MVILHLDQEDVKNMNVDNSLIAQKFIGILQSYTEFVGFFVYKY